MINTYAPFLVYPWVDPAAPQGAAAMASLQTQDLSAVAIRFHFEFHDLVIAYDMLRQTLIERDQQLEADAALLKTMRSAAKTQADELVAARLGESIMSADMMLCQIGRTSVRSSVVNSWIIAEGILSTAYVTLYRATSGGAEPTSVPYQWDKFKAAFKSYGIVLSTLAGYQDANMCRIVNNCIKHGGGVTSQMISSVLFAAHQDKVLRDIDFASQPLVTGAHAFCIALLEATDQKVLNP